MLGNFGGTKMLYIASLILTVMNFHGLNGIHSLS